jgi:hypothetical protein
LSFSDRQLIRQWLTAHGIPQQVGLRSRIVLAAAEGQPESGIAGQLEINRKTAIPWCLRFGEEGLESLREVAPGAVAGRLWRGGDLSHSANDPAKDPHENGPVEIPTDGK